MEIWRTLPSNSAYMVSTLGNVKSVYRYIFNKGAKTEVFYKRKLLKLCTAKNGYIVVNIGRKTSYVHRLVYETFCGIIEAGLTINHKNGNKADNMLPNLEKVTYSENHQHAFRELKRKPSAKGKFGVLHSCSKAVNQFDKTGKLLGTFPNAREAERKLGVSFKHISACANGKRKTAGGFVWSFAEPRRTSLKQNSLLH